MLCKQETFKHWKST